MHPVNITIPQTFKVISFKAVMAGFFTSGEPAAPDHLQFWLTYSSRPTVAQQTVSTISLFC